MDFFNEHIEVTMKVMGTSKLTCLFVSTMLLCVLVLYNILILQYNGVDKKTILIKIPDTRVYIYTAFAVYRVFTVDEAIQAKQNRDFNAIAVNGFQVGKTSMKLPNKCCIMLQNRTIISVTPIREHTYQALAIRRAFQLHCFIKQHYLQIRSVSLTADGNECPTSEQYYKMIDLPGIPSKKPNGKERIAVCAKVAYGDLDVKALTEWIEAYRYLGVDHIFAHTYMLKSEARKVFKHYEKAGLVETREFDMPEKDLQVVVDTNRRQGWNDEQVALYDCQAQLLLYDYVFVVDTDEFLVPTANLTANGLMSLFKGIFSNPNTSSAYFQTVLHITTWGRTQPEHPLLIGKYINQSVPFLEREKIVYMPTRVELGTVTTHMNTPFKPLKRIEIRPDKAVIHHFRSCRTTWLYAKRKEGAQRSDWVESRTLNKTKQPDKYYFKMQAERYCFDFHRKWSTEIEHLSIAIQDNVQRCLLNLESNIHVNTL